MSGRKSAQTPAIENTAPALSDIVSLSQMVDLSRPFYNVAETSVVDIVFLKNFT